MAVSKAPPSATLRSLTLQGGPTQATVVLGAPLAEPAVDEVLAEVAEATGATAAIATPELEKRDPKEVARALCLELLGEEVDFDIVEAAWMDQSDAFLARIANESDKKDLKARQLAIKNYITQYADLIFRNVFGVTLQSLSVVTEPRKDWAARARSFLRRGTNEEKPKLSPEQIAGKRTKIIATLVDLFQRYIQDPNTYIRGAFMGMGAHSPKLKERLPKEEKDWGPLFEKFHRAIFEDDKYQAALSDAKKALLAEEVSKRCISMLKGELLVELGCPEITKMALASMRHTLEADGFIQLYPELAALITEEESA